MMSLLYNKVSSSSLSKYAYTYDALGRRVNRQQTGSEINRASTDNFSYNTRSEVTASTNSVETAAAHNPTYNYDPGNVPPGNPPCTPSTDYRNSQPSGNVERIFEGIVPGSQRYCTDPNTGAQSVIEETEKYGHYVQWQAENWTVYSGGTSCPSAVYNGLEYRLEATPRNYSYDTVTYTCPYGGGGGDSDGDGDGDGNCLKLSESGGNEDSCHKFFNPYVPDLEPVETLPNPDGLNILYERLSYSIPRPGYYPFDFDYSDPPENVTTYLTRTYSRSTLSGCTDPSGGLDGTTANVYNIADLELCTTHTGWNYYTGRSSSLVDSGETSTNSWSIREISSSSNDVRFRYDTTLSGTYSTSQFRSDAKSMMPDFTDVFSYATSYSSSIGASFDLSEGASQRYIYYSKIQFKFKWGGEVSNEDKYPVKYSVIFIPEDDPETEDIDESENVEFISTIPVDWDGESNESGVFEIDPGAISSTKDGDYRLLEVGFETFPDDVPGPGKAHEINLNTRQNEATFYGDFEKFVAYVYTEGNLNLIDYLEGADDPSIRQIFEDSLRWRSNGTDVPHELNFVLEPQDNEIRFFEIEVLPKNDNQVLDRLIITVVPRSTKSAFDAWKSANQDTGWLAELPPLYSSIEAGQDPDRNCNPRIWESPSETDSYYHPAAQFAMRSEETQNGHGHQACYDGSRSLIRNGVSAGTADKAHPSNLVGSDSHKNQDVLPFIWALQLDGNPVEGGTLNLNLTQPIAHEGVFSNEYLGLRPPIVNSEPELQPGSCL